MGIWKIDGVKKDGLNYLDYISNDSVKQLVLLKNKLNTIYNKLEYDGELEKYIKFKPCNYDCQPFLSVNEDDKKFHIITYERGKIISDIEFDSISDTCFYIMSFIVFDIASSYELKNRVKYQDSRRICFQKEIELMGKISDEYANRKKEYIDNILKIAPYNDEVHLTLDIIHDFEKIAKDIKSKDYLITRLSAKGKSSLELMIDDINILHREGTSDLDTRLKGYTNYINTICQEFKIGFLYRKEINKVIDKCNRKIEILKSKGVNKFQ